MKVLKQSVAVIFTAFVFFLCCSKQPTSTSDEANTINPCIESIAKKPDQDGGKPDKTKYSCSLIPSSESFSVNLNYYGGECIQGACYEPTYKYEPIDLNPDQYISFSVNAQSLNGKDWFNYIVLVFYPDLDMDGSPDTDDAIMSFSYSLGYDQKYTEYSASKILFWWGQRRFTYDYPYCCLRMLTQEECGRYLVKIWLRQELNNKKGVRSISRPVYNSNEDANFQEYDNITKGYVPILALGGL